MPSIELWRERVITSYSVTLTLDMINMGRFVAAQTLKGIVHFEMNFWYVLAYLKGIQDVGVFVSTVF